MYFNLSRHEIIHSFIILIGVIGFGNQLKAQEINIDQEFSSDTVFMPFSGSSPVYSVKFTGSINLLSDSSLIRVVLIDDHRNHYLVYEAYPLITTDSAFSVNEVCDETCYLDGIIPDSIRIDIINAFLTFNTLTLEPEYIANTSQLQVQIKVTNDSIKALKMNQRIQNKGMYWHADKTNIVGMSFQDKEKYFGKKFNLYGFDYYTGGIFEFIHHKKNYVPNPSSYVSEFDWRNRHSADKPGSLYYNSGCPGCYGWINRPESQGDWNLCWDYTASHTLADFVNIYCNRFKNYDFSEGKILCLSYPNLGNCNSGSLSDAFQAIHGNGGINLQDGCFSVTCSYFPPPLPPGPTNCSVPCSSDKIDFSTYPNLVWSSTQEELQKAIITLGPIASGILFPTSIYYHAMELVGYKTIHALDTVYSQTNPMPFNGIIYLEDTPINVWIFKNSNWPLTPPPGCTWCIPPPHWVLYNDDNNFIPFVPPIYLTGPVKINQNTVLTKQCGDRDGDGYYWWGIDDPNFTPQQCGCPQGVNADEEDCDDNNKAVGPYNQNYSLEHPLYECKDNCPDDLYSSDPYQIPSYAPNPCPLEWILINQSSPNKHSINQPIVIPSEFTVKVSSTIRMHPRSYIAIQPGGVLKILYNPDPNNPIKGKLTSSCNKLWKGIRVLGSPEQQQLSNQGRVEVNGTIESALYAIKDSIVPLSGSMCGAVIIADGAIFKDNRVAIYDSNYSQPFTLSRIVNCSFIANDTLSDGSYPQNFIKLINLDNVKCLQIRNCTFTETHNENQQIVQRHATGIYANNARFYVIPGSGSNTFSGLQYGIYTQSFPSSSVNPFYIYGYHFTNNARSIYVSGVYPITILNNIIEVPSVAINAPPLVYWAYTSYGIYIEASSNYTVWNNTITGPLPYTDQPAGYTYSSCGLYIKNSGPYLCNQIYKNSVGALNAGIASFGFNRNGENEGLEIKCNSFSSNARDIAVYKGNMNPNPNIGIKYNQGVPNTTISSLSAGDLFSTNVATGHLYDIFNTSGNPINYNHHVIQGNAPTNLVPINNTTNINVHENTYSIYDSSSCPDLTLLSFNNISALLTDLITAKNNIDSLNTVLAILTDGGNTDSVNNAILFSMPPEAWNLYLDLMSKSPYLSDTVLKSAVVKEAVLINALLRDILVANPQAAKSDSILQLLEERFIPMSDSMMAEILEGRTFLGAKEILEGTRASWYQKYGEVFNDILSIYVSDTLHEGMADSIISLMQRDFRLASKYSLAFHMLNQGNIHQADQVIQNIPSTYGMNSYQAEEYQRYYCYYGCTKRAILNNAFLTFDSVQISKLDSLVSTDTNYIFTSTVYARNGLQSAGQLTYNECLFYDTLLQQHPSRPVFHKPLSLTTTYLKLFPNPAKDYVIMDYKVDAKSKDISVSIMSVEGKILKEEKINKTQDQKAISIRNLENGTYLVTLMSDGKKVQSQKLIIIR